MANSSTARLVSPRFRRYSRAASAAGLASIC